MGSMSQITSLTIVYSAVYSGADQIKNQCSAWLAFVWGIHRITLLAFKYDRIHGSFDIMVILAKNATWIIWYKGDFGQKNAHIYFCRNCLHLFVLADSSFLVWHVRNTQLKNTSMNLWVILVANLAGKGHVLVPWRCCNSFQICLIATIKHGLMTFLIFHVHERWHLCSLY